MNVIQVAVTFKLRNVIKTTTVLSARHYFPSEILELYHSGVDGQAFRCHHFSSEILSPK